MLVRYPSMVTCEKCRSQFMADRNIPYPGHCDPPGSLLVYAALFGIVAAVCGTVGIFVFRNVMLVIAAAFIVGAVVSLSMMPEARRVCQQSGGGTCPTCGHENKVTWYS
jgi:hypothetical protein